MAEFVALIKAAIKNIIMELSIIDVVIVFDVVTVYIMDIITITTVINP